METDTQDTTGEVLNRADVSGLEENRVRTVIESFVGTISQIPPMYSALKVNGKKLCDLARAGITVERKAREITIYEIRIEQISLPRVEMTVHCSKDLYPTCAMNRADAGMWRSNGISAPCAGGSISPRGCGSPHRTSGVKRGWETGFRDSACG
ncbi:MAG: hypothetical protein V8R80_08590 [Eubacterium sp.]